jgi:hypothetical protein
MMLPNIAPITNSSSAVSREGAVADFIYMLSSTPALTGRPSAETLDFSWQVLELDATFPEMLRQDITSIGEDFPSKHALGIAKSLCADLDRILPRVVSFSDLEAFEGDLLLHWRSESRSVTLICPADSTRRRKLYREQLDDRLIKETDIAPSPRASDLAREIQWVWNRD